MRRPSPIGSLVPFHSIGGSEVEGIVVSDADEAEDARDVDEGNERIEHILRNLSSVIA